MDLLCAECTYCVRSTGWSWWSLCCLSMKRPPREAVGDGEGVLSRGSRPRAPDRLAAEDREPVGLVSGDMPVQTWGPQSSIRRQLPCSETGHLPGLSCRPSC